MSNMSYCRFENTYSDLEDCYEALCEDSKELSESEQSYKKKLIELCKTIADKFSEEETED